MPERRVRSTYSQAPVQILLYDGGGIVSSGSGFFFTHRADRYLITNWHIVTGRNFFTRAVLDKVNARTPSWLEIKTSTWVDDVGIEPRRFGVSPKRLEIYGNSAAQTDRLWLEHPRLQCDVVAIRLPKPADEPDLMHNSVNLISTMKIPVRPGGVAFVIGFPKNLSVGFGLPIWKSTFVASEPFYDVVLGGELHGFGGMKGGTRYPAFFLDGYTREGMSGSPVFAYFNGIWDMNNPYAEIDVDAAGFWDRDDVALNASASEFIGIYSGRLPEQEAQAALGLCWRRELIDEICAS